MARSLSLPLSLSKNRLTAAAASFLPSSHLLSIRSQSASQSPSDPLIQKLEDAVHRIVTHGIAQLVAKLANPLTDEESLSTNSSRGWPSSDYFLKGVQPLLMETKTEATSNTESHSKDEEG
ncbi:hypothetical protein Bca101_095061 [Brassica carinata]